MACCHCWVGWIPPAWCAANSCPCSRETSLPPRAHSAALTGWCNDDSRRRSSGLVAPPASLTLIKIVLVAAAGVAVVAICSINRANLGTVAGVPWVIPIVLALVLDCAKFALFQRLTIA